MHYTDKLESTRLRTRFLEATDAVTWEEYCNDAVATRFSAIPVATASEMARFWIDFQLQRYAEGRLGLQALIDKSNGRFIGMCGLLLQQVNGQTEIEVGYHLLPSCWGNGYAAEAAILFRDHAFNNYDVASIISLIHPDNIRSQQVALRNGMKVSEHGAGPVSSLPLHLRDKPYLIFRITKEEWQKIK